MTQVRKILIADDDDDLRDELVEQLALHAEFEPLHAATAQTASLAAREAAPDLIIMDVGLPDMDGREAVRQLRGEGYKNPIIMLTGTIIADPRHDQRARCRRQRLCDQAVQVFGFAGAHARAFAPA